MAKEMLKTKGKLSEELAPGKKVGRAVRICLHLSSSHACIYRAIE